MASHGIPRGSGSRPKSEQARKKEAQKIQEYQSLVKDVSEKIKAGEYTSDTLKLTSKVLSLNPEYYTIWNYRRLTIRHLFGAHESDTSAPDPAEHGLQQHRLVAELITNDLDFLLPLLREHPKCYWIWNYRVWLLGEASRLLPTADSCSFWSRELGLVRKMLSLDNRNFHGWGYRRMIIAALERTGDEEDEPPKNLTEEEFQYTTRMIETNLSNFSAWHNRSKLIPRLLTFRKASETERRKFLDSELELIQRALYTDSTDQSLWFYYQYLIGNFDPKYMADSIIPDLTLEEKKTYLKQEHDKTLEMLDGAEDCKWIYQLLIQLFMMQNALDSTWLTDVDQIQTWIAELRKLDPLRAGRWDDLDRKLAFASSSSAVI